MSLNPYEPPRTFLLDRAQQAKSKTIWPPQIKVGIVWVFAVTLGAAICFQLLALATPFVDDRHLMPGLAIALMFMGVAFGIATWFGYCTHRSERWGRWIAAQSVIILLLMMFQLLPSVVAALQPGRGVRGNNGLRQYSGNFQASPIHARPGEHSQQ